MEKAVAAYDPQAEEKDENLEFQETDTVSNGVLFGRFAGPSETFLLWFGLGWSLVFGAALPGFCFVFGELINDMGSMASSNE